MGYGLGLHSIMASVLTKSDASAAKAKFGPPTDTQTQVQNEQPTDPLAFWAAPSEDGQSRQAGLQLRF